MFFVFAEIIANDSFKNASECQTSGPTFCLTDLGLNSYLKNSLPGKELNKIQ